MGKRKAVCGVGCEGGKGRWCWKAVRNKAKLKRKGKTQNSNRNNNKNKQKPNKKMTAHLTDTRTAGCVSGRLTGSPALTGDSTLQNTREEY